MFDRFTDKAKKSMNLARVAAQEFGHEVIAPEHMLLGVLSVGECTATKILAVLAIAPEILVNELRARMTSGTASAFPQLPFTPSGKLALEKAMQAASAAGHDWIGTEHLLVGIAGASSEAASQVLRAHELTPQRMMDAFDQVSPGAEAPPAREASRKAALRRAMVIATELQDFETARRLLALIEKLRE